MLDAMLPYVYNRLLPDIIKFMPCTHKKILNVVNEQWDVSNLGHNIDYFYFVKWTLKVSTLSVEWFFFI